MRNFMKKSFLLLLITLLIFGMTACDSSIDREILFAPDGDYSIEMEGDICYLAITDREIKNKIKREEIEHEILTANGWYINIASSTLKFCSVEELKEKGLWIFAAEAGGSPYYETDFNCGCGIILGSEGNGVSRLLKENSDYIVSIPMYGKVNSLNVSTAASVILCHVARVQRG